MTALEQNRVVDRTSSSDAKIRVFRSLFRGREDVYPRRFESRKTGRAGYAPACANEWVRGVCENQLIGGAPITDRARRVRRKPRLGGLLKVYVRAA
jgi:hypothetical protein